MNNKLNELLKKSNKQEILDAYKKALENSEEAPFWKEKIVPFVDAILSVLIPLKEQNLLFSPEGKIVKNLDSELFYAWTDLISLRTLAFTIEQSNQSETLLRTEYKDVNYSKINLEILGTYLSSFRVNLQDEDNLDFPVANYNLHIGMTTIIKTLI